MRLPLALVHLISPHFSLRQADGKYPCERCDSKFESFRALGAHATPPTHASQSPPHPRHTHPRHAPTHATPPTLSHLPAGCHLELTHPACSPPPCKHPGIHSRNCDGGLWRCTWCNCKADETSGKAPGPDGPRTLCGNCGGRYRSGAVRAHRLPPNPACTLPLCP